MAGSIRLRRAERKRSLGVEAGGTVLCSKAASGCAGGLAGGLRQAQTKKPALQEPIRSGAMSAGATGGSPPVLVGSIPAHDHRLPRLAAARRATRPGLRKDPAHATGRLVRGLQIQKKPIALSFRTKYICEVAHGPVRVSSPMGLVWSWGQVDGGRAPRLRENRKRLLPGASPLPPSAHGWHAMRQIWRP